MHNVIYIPNVFVFVCTCVLVCSYVHIHTCAETGKIFKSKEAGFILGPTKDQQTWASEIQIVPKIVPLKNILRKHHLHS